LSILYAGNLANVGYYHTKQLRNTGTDIELVMEKDPAPNADPLMRDSELKNYPDWINFYDRHKSSWKISLLRIMRKQKYELIHAHVELPIFAYFSRKKFIAQVLGSDIKELAFTNSLRGILLRKAYKNAKLVIFSTPGDPSLLSKLKVKNTLFLPLIWDLSFFKPEKVIDNEFENKFIVFHPTSHIWNVKGNNNLINGFSEFVKQNPDSILICINIGKDIEKSHDLVKSLGIENNVRFMDRLNASQILHYYNLADVVANEFILDGIGGIGMETLCCEKPLLTACHENCYKNMHPEPVPAINVKTSTEIYEKLEYLKDRKVKDEIGKKGRIWMKKFLAPTVVAHKYKTVYDSVLAGDKIEHIKEKISKL